MTPRQPSARSSSARSVSMRSAGRRSTAASATTQPPVIDPITLDNLVDTTANQLDPRDSYDGIRLPAADLSGHALSPILLSESELVGCTAHGTDFPAARFFETRFTRFNAPIFTAPRATLRDVVIEG